ncbi:MAG: demethylmenaquinone methyltransferase [Candidatus Scalindua sp. AMX11]|nr:MAG: demethylmenaquinone methyltransferase [Candidatus Scalindua sp.]NOG85070.1 demethylmenaquinone methyltransferase [Planctomycetota bacterium]RZV93117.1 MAG: demethylmenaquinone methyltransferase [Candidatus Scalindua sp. SCAELEC01]TDE66805.1 MAG: demethylmenaquinone methyltransferase [Candidatus Scalindua sp. AMX11]
MNRGRQPLTEQETQKERSDNIKSMFSSIVRVYDFLNAFLSLNRDKSWRKFTVKVSDMTPNMKILDVCTGTGDLAISFSQQLNGNGLVVGSDYCHDMLRYGKPKIEKRQIADKIKLIEADTLKLPFPDNTFDISTVGFGIRNVTDLMAGIKEMGRVIIPNGKVIILEFSQPTNFIFRGIYFFYFRKILPIIGKIVSKSKFDAYSYLPNSVLAFPNKDELKRKMEECGLIEVKIFQKTFGIVTIHIGSKPPDTASSST